jgi:hypothetical protein
MNQLSNHIPTTIKESRLGQVRITVDIANAVR